jgi:TetR/AcrR family transcriptional repressor of nem operon
MMDCIAEMMANLLVNNWQGALLRMKIEQSVQPIRSVCE